MVTATVRWEGKRSFRGLSASGREVRMDTAPEAGGEGAGLRPMELVLIALGGCVSTTLVSILERMRQPLEALEVALEGERAEAHPRVYTRIRVLFRARGEGLDPAKVRRAVGLAAGRYCSVGNMLHRTAAIEYACEVNGAVFTVEELAG